MRSMTRSMEWVLLGAGVSSAFGCSDSDVRAPKVTARDAAALGQSLVTESEPNATSATANTIGNDVVVRANLVPNGDNDFFRFQAPANARVYAATMTAFSSASDVGDGDSILDLLGTNGTTVIESNDDQGAFGQLASTIAGATTSAAGNHFLRVREASADQQLRPYDLHLRVLSGAPTAEVEPNDSTATANPLGTTRWASGAVTAGNPDWFSLPLAAGDTVFASLDTDPERDGAWDAVLDFGMFGGTTVYSDDTEGFSSETVFATVKYAGTYYVGVSGFGDTDAGTYQLSVGVHPATPGGRNCVTFPSTDVPKAITDAGRTTSTVTVPGQPRIGDLDVSIQMAHARVPDLDVHLRSPAGSDIALFTDVGLGTLDDLDLVIDDEAALPLSQADDDLAPWTDWTALLGLTVQPEMTNTVSTSSGSRLHWFDGQNAGGTWTLVVDDDLAGQTGSLLGWSVTVCEPPATRACPSGGSLVQAVNANFNSGADGFTSSGTGNQWARGIPSAPATFVGCNGGSQGCWKTNLTGAYAPNTLQTLVSPAINLTNAVAPVTLSWAMKYQLESASMDHAWVEVRDAMAARNDRVWEFLDPTMRETVGAETLEESAGWGVYTVDLSAYAGRTVQVAFRLESNADVQLGGFAVDDFSVSHCGCGDGVVGPGEQCDLGPQNGQAGRCCSSSCSFITNGTGCNDNSACTSAEVCTNGTCGGGTPVTCDDSNVCTDNACNPQLGCVYTPNTGPCPNGTCQAGMCQMGGMGGAGAGGGPSGGVGGVAGAGGNPTGGGGAGGTSSAGGGAGGASGGAGGVVGGMSGAAGTPGGAAGTGGGQSGTGGTTQGGGAGAPGGEGGAPEGGAGQGGADEGGAAGEATGGSSRGGSSSGGMSILPDSGVSGTSGTGGTSGTSGDSGGEGGEAVTDRHAKDIESDSSCGCRIPGTPRQSALPTLLALALSTAALGRRRRRAPS